MAEKFTPMMEAYLETKKEYQDCILFYRLGDFYEMFFDDALVASKELELTLTGKSCGLEERAPMCGIPYHACETYLSRLINKGYKVAICEQMEDENTKGIMKREVVRIVTPGTNLDTKAIASDKNNFIVCLYQQSHSYGFAACDVTTGDFYVTELTSRTKLYDELSKYDPSELLCTGSFAENNGIYDWQKTRVCAVTGLEEYYFDESEAVKTLYRHFKVSSLNALDLEDFKRGSVSAGALFRYLYETQKSSLGHINHINVYLDDSFMMLDGATRRNLELLETMRDKEKRGSLLWVLDKTRTAMGGRTLRSYIKQPLIQKAEIIKRQDAIEELCDKFMSREELREYLNPVYDLERLITRIAYQSANAIDLLALRQSFEMLPGIKMVLSEYDCQLLKDIYLNLDDLNDLFRLIDDSISPDAPLSLRDGDLIKPGYNEEVDRLRSAKTDGKQWLLELEEREKERTGIKKLRVKYNRVFGYYIEVTNSFLDMVPDDYIRKQTLANAERFYTPELKELENTILGAEERLNVLEYELFKQVREALYGEILRIQNTAKSLAELDVLISLSVVSQNNNYVRPSINEDGIIDIKDGRHPVIEKMIDPGMFVCNDTYLDSDRHLVSIITGPNMAGKSTYMRQTALIVLMAQMGCFVPAREANIGIVDRIFTRVGASDDLASGQSTFMVEMNEVANILRNATRRSLLILDEIGRGTSTYDGLSIAWSVVEHICDKNRIGAKTLFATHYHELTELEGKLDGVNNYCILVKENGDDIVFLRKIASGGADKSYGIQVAKLAGVPDAVIRRAKEIAAILDNNKTSENVEIKSIISDAPVTYDQLSFSFDNTGSDITDEIKELDISSMSPIDALLKLADYQKRLNNE